MLNKVYPPKCICWLAECWFPLLMLMWRGVIAESVRTNWLINITDHHFLQPLWSLSFAIHSFIITIIRAKKAIIMLCNVVNIWILTLSNLAIFQPQILKCQVIRTNPKKIHAMKRSNKREDMIIALHLSGQSTMVIVIHTCWLWPALRVLGQVTSQCGRLWDYALNIRQGSTTYPMTINIIIFATTLKTLLEPSSARLKT